MTENKKASWERGFYKWRRRADLNRRLYSFANCSLGPLGHVSSKKTIFKELRPFVNDSWALDKVRKLEKPLCL
jgi:hypothetical protein